MILLLTRVPEVHVVTHGNYNSEAIAYNVENVEWLEKRFNYLKEEMVMMETQLESMHHEYALLKSRTAEGQVLTQISKFPCSHSS